MERAALWSTPWVAHGMRRPAPALRLFCFPCAGGSASSYRQWPSHFPETIEICPIQLPGREARSGEALATDLLALAEDIAAGIDPMLDVPFAFFGHSLGGLLAFEVARDLRKHGQHCSHLFIAGTPAPHRPRSTAPVHRLSDDDLLAYLKGLNGTPQAVLEKEWLLRMHLPMLRADMTCLETYVYARESLLNIPITGFAGTDDTQVSADAIESWHEETAHRHNLVELPGGHFFVQDSIPALAPHIVTSLGI